MSQVLSKREETILCNVIEQYIRTALPVGSRYISQKTEVNLSSATIRNVMCDLEDLGFLSHPHASAGRIPTELGYRTYVNDLMEPEKISQTRQFSIKNNLKIENVDDEQFFKLTARIISSITNQLTVISFPTFGESILRKIELIEISSNRFVVLLSLDNGIIKTIMLEVNEEIPHTKLNKTAQILNEKLSGLTLTEINQTFVERIKNTDNADYNVIKIFIDSADKIFNQTNDKKLYFDLPSTLVTHPEFENANQFKTIIELLNNKEMIIHYFKKNENENSVSISIGSETGNKQLQNFSVVSSNYNFKNGTGAIGVIGPTRMQYTRIVPLIDYVSKTLSSLFLHTT